MKAYICDHCGIQVEATRNAVGRGHAGPAGWKAVRAFPLGRVADKTAKTHELCVDCAAELDAFLTKGANG